MSDPSVQAQVEQILDSMLDHEFDHAGHFYRKSAVRQVLTRLITEQQELRDDLKQSRAETEGADALTKAKIDEMEHIWQLHVASKRRAEKAEAENTQLRDQLAAQQETNA